jgi:hypothetical protein
MRGRLAALFGEKLTLPMPVCKMHRWYLNRYIVVVWVLAAILAIAALLLVPASMLLFFKGTQESRAWAETIWIAATVIFVPMILTVSMLLGVKTVCARDFTSKSIDLVGVADKFVHAVQATSMSTTAGISQPVGVALPPEKTFRTVLIVIGLSLGYVCCLGMAGYAVNRAAKAKQRKQLDDFIAARKQQPRLPPESSSVTPTRPQRVTDKRLEKMKVASGQNFPRNTREIRATTELRPGMEVWARDRLSWRKCTVTRVDNPVMAHIRFTDGDVANDRVVPAMLIRIAQD